MKKTLILLAVVSLFAPSCGKMEDQKKEITKEDLKTEDEMASYSLGFSTGVRFKNDESGINLEIFQRGVKDGFTGSDQMLNEEEMNKAMTAWRRKTRAIRQEQRKKEMEERKKQEEENKAKGEKFLEENKTKEGVVALESGLQYKILKEGTGASPKETDTLKCHYKGTTIDGKEFDNSYERGEPATFAFDRAIEGWKEALKLMKVDAKWQLFIPPQLAYGERGSGKVIGPNETLIFEVELLGIEEPETEEPKKKD